MAVKTKPLGRRVPEDFDHVEKYPLSALPAAQIPSVVPVVIGVNWYDAFDKPVLKNGRYYIGLDPHNLGAIRGGHCVCLKPDRMVDTLSWWDFYDQGREGACVGFGSSRAMSLLNRKRYYARWLWDHAKLIDDWADTNPGDDNGTSVRAAMDVLRTQGHVVWKAGLPSAVAARDALVAVPGEGIAANRWATQTDQIRGVLQSPRHDTLGCVPIVNSWGRSYPHYVWMPYETLQRLLNEDGEATLVTDR